MIGRRGFLQRFGVGVIAAPAAAKSAMEKAQAELANVVVSGAGGALAPSQSPDGAALDGFSLRKHLAGVLQNAEHRDVYTSLLFQRHRWIGYIDVDLATKRSFSLAAKVTYQRQRNVAREIAEDTAESPLWQRGEAYVRRAVGWKPKF